MIIDRYKDFKKFLNLYKIDEHIFHISCNSFLHTKLTINDQKMQDSNLNSIFFKNFYLIINGKLKAYYEKDQHPNDYENFFLQQRRLIKEEKELIKIKENKNYKFDYKNNNDEINNDNENYYERILSVGDYFCENIKHKGYILKKIEVIDDTDLIYLTKEIFDKTFGPNLNKFEKNKRSFILKTINYLNQLPRNRYEIFLNHVDTIVKLIF
jgi:hypothetical protein